MQKLNLPRRTCGQKKNRHHTRVEADAHRASLEAWEREHGPARPGRLNTYWCPDCGAWHVGHTTGGGS